MWPAVVASQVVLLPILLGLFLGIRRENDRRERMLRASLKALGIVSVLRGSRRDV